MAADMVASGGDEAVSVCIRVRPFNQREIDIELNQPHAAAVLGSGGISTLRSVIEMPDGLGGKLRLMHRDESGEYSEVETFQFSRTFWSIPEQQQPHKYQPLTQEDVFHVIGRPIVANALGGFHVCVFAYGQTGSGKTHTMMGDLSMKDKDFEGDAGDAQLGIIPRLCKELFTSSASRCKEMCGESPENTELRIDIKLSALEIYNEQVRDLFWKDSPFPHRTKATVLKIRKHPTEGHFVDELTTLNAHSWEECVRLISTGVAERTVAATLMNDESSRSHSVFQIVVTQTETVAPDPSSPYSRPVVTTRVSRINLVDLAGSERLKKSGAQGQQLREAAGINQSLSTLKKVIDALVLNSTERNPKKHVLVPYRESALTQLLSHSLGGNSKTTMIACVSPHYDNQDETLLTLRYANRAKGIINHVKSNEDNTARQEKLLKEQLAALQMKLSEGPSVLSEVQLSDLRDQLAIGSKALEELHAQHAAQEKEAARLAEKLKGQRDARFAASYYSSFKRVLLERVRDRAQTKIHALEAQLSRVSRDKDHLAQAVAERDRSLTESLHTLRELQKKEELSRLRSSRNEALARQLTREIAKAKRKADENLRSRFGLMWIRDRNLKHLRAHVQQQRELCNREHEQYLQSIVREAKKQFDYLCSTYSDKETVQREKLAAIERRREQSLLQLEKAQHLLLSLRSTLERVSAEHDRRERERLTSWSKRFEDMKSLYTERIGQLLQRQQAADETWQQRNGDTEREAALTHDEQVVALQRRLAAVRVEGDRRACCIVAEIEAEMDLLRSRCASDSQRAAQELERTYECDERLLLQAIESAKRSLAQKHQTLATLHRYASHLEASASHTETALESFAATSICDSVLPLDAECLLRDAAAFLARYQRLEPPGIETRKIAALLRRSSVAIQNTTTS